MDALLYSILDVSIIIINFNFDLLPHFLFEIAVIFIIDVVGIMCVILIYITPLASNDLVYLMLTIDELQSLLAIFPP